MPVNWAQCGDEWLETDGEGGFASGTVNGIRTRRYHGLLVSATTPPTGRVMLVNGFDAWVETSSGRFALSSQRYQPDVIHPVGAQRIVNFSLAPWPRWTYRLEDGTEVIHECAVCRSPRETILRWRIQSEDDATLIVRPFLSGRNYHGLCHQKPPAPTETYLDNGTVTWFPGNRLPAITVFFNGVYGPELEWYEQFLYEEEQTRGFDCEETLVSPGHLIWRGQNLDAALILRTAPLDGGANEALEDTAAYAKSALKQEKERRDALPSDFCRAADHYIVRRGAGKTIIAGYPWFTDWGRDTFIALRGLCLATGRFDDARDILLTWAEAMDEGMIPNRFPDTGRVREFNSVDASLWFVISVYEYLSAVDRAGVRLLGAIRTFLWTAAESVLTAYRHGTRTGIRLDDDGLIACGSAEQQLTWMDAKVDGEPVTPRHGKPVEVQSLWLNALWALSARSSKWGGLYEHGLKNFRRKFWITEQGYLADVADAGHEPGAMDTTFRPNQIFAIGGLPLALLSGKEASSVVDQVEKHLLTPMGLRTLSPEEHAFCPRYEGGPAERDRAYHQGTVWPWLMGPFVEAWLRVRSYSAEARETARTEFLDPLRDQLNTAGLAHVSELADAEAPHRPRGCPFQAWSLAEYIRLEAILTENSALAPDIEFETLQT